MPSDPGAVAREFWARVDALTAEGEGEGEQGDVN